MDKKEFFESLITSLPNSSGQRIEAFERITEIFHSIKSELMDEKLKTEFGILEKDILFRVWMLEQICNSKDTIEADTIAL